MKLPSLHQALLPLFFRPAPELEVEENLRLACLRQEEAEELYLLIEANRPHLEPWLSWIEQMQNLYDVKKFIRQLKYQDVYSGRWVYGIRFEDKLIGLIDFNEGRKDLQQISIGYWLAEEYQGKGIITRAVRRCLQYVFEEKNLLKVTIKCAANNRRSIAVPSRLNFSWEAIEREAGTVKGVMQDLITFGMSYRQWKDQREETGKPQNLKY